MSATNVREMRGFIDTIRINVELLDEVLDESPRARHADLAGYVTEIEEAAEQIYWLASRELEAQP